MLRVYPALLPIRPNIRSLISCVSVNEQSKLNETFKKLEVSDMLHELECECCGRLWLYPLTRPEVSTASAVTRVHTAYLVHNTVLIVIARLSVLVGT